VRPALASASPLGIRIYVGYPIIAVKSAIDADDAEVSDFEEFLDAVLERLGDAPDGTYVAA
jgi:hypothetical protein